jgi:two-component system sensor histidine kinase TctE
VALELSPLIADKDLDFEIATTTAPVRSMSGCCANSPATLLQRHQAHARRGTLSVQLVADLQLGRAHVRRQRSGLPPLRERLFQPFRPARPAAAQA